MTTCSHGGVGIKCLVCERETELADLHAELESLRRDADRWRAIAPMIRLESDGWETVCRLYRLVAGSTTIEHVVDRLVEEAKEKP